MLNKGNVGGLKLLWKLKLDNISYFSLPDAGATKKDFDTNVSTPVIFSYKDRDLIAAAGKDGPPLSSRFAAGRR
jgi:hypothetical protein